MKKRTLVVLLCLVLVCSFAACDIQFGGLLGELFETDEILYHPPLEDVIPEPGSMDSWLENEGEIGTNGSYVELPAYMYAGYQVVVLGDLAYDLGSTDSQDNIVERLTYARNQTVQEKYGILIDSKYVMWSDITNEVKNAVQSGSTDYDIVLAPISVTGSTLAMQDLLMNLNELPYLDLGGAAWDTGINEGLAIGAYLPMATGQIVPSSDLGTSLLVFSTKMAEDYGVDMYDYVLCGGWTLAKMHAIVNEFYLDLNGDAMPNAGDQFGLAIDNDHVYAFACGADAMWIDKDDQNLPVLNTVTDLERIVSAYEQFYQMMQEYSVRYNNADGNSQESAFAIFEQENAFIYATTYEEMLFDLSGADMKYGVLPYPKLDEEQRSYQSFVSTAANAVMVPASARDVDLVGYTLEALAQASDQMYFASLSTRACRSAQDVEMLSLVLDSKTLDFGSNYLLNVAGSPVQHFKNALMQNNTSITTFIKMYEKTISKELQNILNVSH